MVIAIKDNDRIVLGYTNGELTLNVSADDYALDDNCGIWRLPSHRGCIVAAAGSNAGMDLIRYNPSLFKGELDYKHLTEVVAPRIRRFFAQHGQLDDNGDTEFKMVVAVGDKIYNINYDLFVMEMGDLHVLSVTENVHYVNAYLDTCGDIPVESKLIGAVRTVDEMTGVRHFPLIIMDTKSGRRKVIYG